MTEQIPDYIGHRKRLRERFLKNNGADMADYEALELLLSYVFARKDVKPLAKKLIAKFGSFAAVISAPTHLLLEVDGIKESSATLIKFIRFAVQKFTWQKLESDDMPIISSTENLLDFCYCSMAHLEVETLRLIYLNSKLKVIDTEVIQSGSISSVSIHQREVIAKSLAHNAAGIIMIHNHPSGEVKPSMGDIEVTRRIEQACDAAEIILHEHLIIGNTNYYSFLENGLLQNNKRRR